MADGFVVAMKRGNTLGAKEPYYCKSFNKMRGKDKMIKESINLQELRRKIYIKAKSEKSWQFWGMYVHVCKLETLKEAYKQVKSKRGAPGIDGVTFVAIEDAGVDEFLKQLQHELITKTYYPTRNRKAEIPKENGKTRILNIPTIRDRVVQTAVKLILEPIFESDFQAGSFGYRPKRTAENAIKRVEKAVIKGMTKVIDVDLKSYFDTIKHNILLNKIAKRINDKDIMRLLKLIIKANSKNGVPQGSPLSPLLSNIYLNEVDKMLEKAKEVTKKDGYDHLEYARWADDIVILIDGHSNWNWLVKAAYKRLNEELMKLGVKLNEEKTKQIDMIRDETFSFLGFKFKRKKSRKGKWTVLTIPKTSARTKLLKKIKDIFRQNRSGKIKEVVGKINPIIRGWVNYFKIGNSSKTFSYVRNWVEKKIRRHMMHAKGLQGFGWKRWSYKWIYENLELYSDYKVKYS